MRLCLSEQSIALTPTTAAHYTLPIAMRNIFESENRTFSHGALSCLHQTKLVSVSVPIPTYHSWLCIVVVWILDPDIAFLGNFAEVLPVAIYHNYDREHNKLPAQSQLYSTAFSLFTTTWSPGARRCWERSPLLDRYVRSEH